MKNIFKRLLSVFVSILIAMSSLSVITFAGSDNAYPKGVTADSAAQAVDSTDKLLASVSKSFGSVKAVVTPMLYNSSVLSTVLVKVYGSLSEKSDELKSIGIDTSVQAVAGALAGYKSVNEALLKAADWASVDLSKADWGVKDKNSFATALSASFSPLNDILYMLLCSGSYSINKLIKIDGGNGYDSAIVPLLKSLNCTGIMSQADFTAAADADKNSMVKNIITPVLTLLETACDSPAGTLTVSLPGLAYFINSGKLDECLSELIKPITENKLVEIAVFLKILDLESFDFDIESMMGTSVDTMAADSGIKMPEIDMARLASCGKESDGTFVADKGQAYVDIMRWLIDALKQNASSLPELMKKIGGGKTAGMPDSADISKLLDNEMFSSILKKDTDVLLSTLISLFTPAKPGAAANMLYPTLANSSVSYTANLSEEKFKKALKEIDPLIDEFVAEYSDYDTIGATLSASIYTNANINKLTVSLYSAVEKAGASEALTMLGIDLTPSGVAALLTESGYSSAKKALQKASSWSKVSLSGVTWNFTDGRRTGFENALTAVLRPLFPALKFLLAGEDIVLLDTITVKGADGYNSAVIPILEALGCKSKDIKTYEEYTKDMNTDGIIKDILEPVFNLLDKAFESPVDTLTEILPNIIYFMDSGSVDKCVSNLMLPVTAVTEKLSPIYKMEFDTSSLTKDIDLNKIINSFIKEAGIKTDSMDIKALSTLGTLKTHTSKRTVDGKKAQYSYVEADKTAVFITVLRFLVDTLKSPDNADLLTNLMSSSQGGGAFASYSSSITDQFEGKTTDEIIEWLYNLLFKERVIVPVTEASQYSPTIIYEQQKKKHTALYIAGGVVAFEAIVGAVLYLNRKRLFN